VALGGSNSGVYSMQAHPFVERRVRGYYSDFLRSPYWRALRRQVIWICLECNRCGCKNNLQVHHNRYNDLGTDAEYYRFMGLELLCRTCHAAHHGKPAEIRNHDGPELLGDIMHRLGRDAAA
jgi:hypothetical protein